MPPRPTPRPSGQSRRRPGPYLPGSLILMLIGACLFVAFIYNPIGGQKTIDYSDFVRESELHNLKKVTFVGKERARGEVKNNDEEFTRELKLPDGKFDVS